MDYTFSKYKDKYTIKNNSIIETLTVKIYYKDCETSTKYLETTILPGKEFEVIFRIDGIFSIVLNDGTIEEVLPDILYYQNTLSKIIDLTQKILCGCGPCTECEDCFEDVCEEILQCITLGTLFRSFNYPLYETLFERVQEELKCLIEGCALHSVNKSLVNGKLLLKDSQKYIIGQNYLAFYFQDILSASDNEEAEYIKSKYRYLTISNCLKKMGIEINEDSVLLNEPNVTVDYFMTDNYNITSSSINLVTIPTQSISTRPFTDYEEGFTVPLSSINGKVVLAIKETLFQNYNIYDDMGNDITNSFESTYYATEKTKVFVSLAPYAPGNFYFKFKKLIYNG